MREDTPSFPLASPVAPAPRPQQRFDAVEATVPEQPPGVPAPQSCSVQRMQSVLQSMARAADQYAGRPQGPDGSDRAPACHSMVRPAAVESLSPPGQQMPQRPRGQRELAVTADCLRELSARVLGAREDERRLLARELHDEVGQRLTAIKLGLMGMAEDGGPGIQDDRLNALIQLVEGTVNSVRRLSADLRPLMLDDLGLPDAIEWLARDAAQRLDLEVTVRFFNPELEIRDPAATALYRIVQEALANVGRHAQATDVRIELLREGNELVLTVEDNGTGFPEGALDAGQALGLLGMCERAHMLGGHLELSNPPGSGGRVQVRTPLGGQSWDLNANSPTVWSQPIPPP